MQDSFIEAQLNKLIEVGANDRVEALKWLVSSVWDQPISQNDWQDTRLIDLVVDKLGISYSDPLFDEIVSLRF